MKLEQIYTGCLAEAAYYIESEGEVAIIDPLRETKPYTDKAERNGAKIKYVFETHFHADFVSGHLDLAAKTGAQIIFGPTAAPGYNAYVAKDHERFKLGKVEIEVLHTPGHTMESSCFLLYDENGVATSLFTGDTLFIGDVGRPDLVQKVKADITPEFLAGKLYDSLHTQIMPLGDDIIVYPGHGAGSACGKNMSKETTDTLGNQKRTNYALNTNLSKEEFIKEVTEGLAAPPAYFPKNVILNLQGGMNSIDEIIRRGTQPLSVDAFRMVWEAEEALVIDARPKSQFVKGFIPGAIFIGLEDNFAPWVGALVPDLQQPILLVTEPGQEEEAVIRLSRVGYDNALGFLDGGIQSWTAAGNELDRLNEIDAQGFAELFEQDSSLKILDVRRESEYRTQHIDGAQNLPLDNMNEHMAELNTNETYYLHCAGGYRSVIAASILKSRGFDKLVNIQGGFKALSQTALAKSEFEKQSSLL